MKKPDLSKKELISRIEYLESKIKKIEKTDFDDKLDRENCFQENIHNILLQLPYQIEIYDIDGKLMSSNHCETRKPQFDGHACGDYNILKDRQVKELGLDFYFGQVLLGKAQQLPDYEFDPSKSGMIGRKAWKHARILPIKNKNGTLQSVMLIAENINERKKTENILRCELEQSLKESVTKNRMLTSFQNEIDETKGLVQEVIDNISQPISICDKKKNILFANSLYNKQMIEDPTSQYFENADSKTEMNIQIGVPVESRKSMRHTVANDITAPNQIIGKHNNYFSEQLLQPTFASLTKEKDKSKLYQNFSSSNLHTELDVILNQIELYKDSTTQIKRNEEQLSEAQRLAKIGSWEFDLFSNQFKYSDEMCQIFEIEFTNNYTLADFVQLVSGFDKINILRCMAKIRETDQLLDCSNKIEINGGIKTIHTVLRSEKDYQGNLKRVSGTCQDISGFARFFKEDQKRNVSEKMKDLDNGLIDMLSHEYRNPLTVILSSSYLINIASKGMTNSKVPKHVQKIKSSVHSMTILMDNTLALLSNLRDNKQIEQSDVNLSTMMTEMIDEVKSIDNGRHRFTFVENDNRVVVETDMKILRLIVFNLLVNSVKFSEESTEVKVSIVEKEKEIIIAIEDQGIGIAEEYMKNIFDPFFKLKCEHDFIPGTGLGLTIVHQNAEKIGVKISVDSQVGKGSTFRITFRA